MDSHEDVFIKEELNDWDYDSSNNLTKNSTNFVNFRETSNSITDVKILPIETDDEEIKSEIIEHNLVNDRNMCKTEAGETQPPVFDSVKQEYDLEVDVSVPTTISGAASAENFGLIIKGESVDETINAEESGKRCKRRLRSTVQPAPHQQVHSKTGTHTCNVCNKTFTQVSSLTRHAYVHSTVKAFKCKVCEKAFSRVGDLTVHERVHTGEKPFKCTMCKKTFASSSHLAVHKRTHTEDKPYKCTTCNKSFKQSNQLTVHKRTHSGEKPYKCSTCNMTYADGSNLTAHERRHSGVKPYKCTVCRKAFTLSTDRTAHERIHMRHIPLKLSIRKKGLRNPPT